MSSVFGKNIIISLFGESHGEYVGAVIDGLPSGETIDLVRLKSFLARRAPSRIFLATERNEDDEFQILSGIFRGKTNGAPLAVTFKNKDKLSDDYTDTEFIPRPSQSDFTAHIRYNGFNDFHGGGHLSGRLTAPLCFAGGICLQLLEKQNVFIGAHLFSVGNIYDTAFDPANIPAEDLTKLSNNFPCTISEEKGKKIIHAVEEMKCEGDSLGGIIECATVGFPVGKGSPHFDGIENLLARAMFGIPAVKGIEFGSGFSGSHLSGQQNNDPFFLSDTSDRIITKTNNHGGILGGISSGMPIVFRVAIKPTPSISAEQNSIDLLNFQTVSVSTHGRHDPCIALRSVPCIEAVTAAVLLDILS